MGELESLQEPFECPHCGQLLDPRCRVCVACDKEVDQASIRQRTPPTSTAPSEEAKPPSILPFPWSLCILLGLGSLGVQQFFNGLTDGGGGIFAIFAQGLTVLWVYFDSREKAVSVPMRWTLGTLFLWIVVFPWYLTRRNRPDYTCPFVEGDLGRFVRALIYVNLCLVFIYALIFSQTAGSSN